MSSFSEFLKSLKTHPKRRSYRYADPANGLEYNQINASQRASRRIYEADIARTPRIVKDYDEFVNVHAKAYKANQANSMINYCQHKVSGRRRL